jgi:hypothetical protein
MNLSFMQKKIEILKNETLITNLRFLNDDDK